MRTLHRPAHDSVFTSADRRNPVEARSAPCSARGMREHRAYAATTQSKRPALHHPPERVRMGRLRTNLRRAPVSNRRAALHAVGCGGAATPVELRLCRLGSLRRGRLSVCRRGRGALLAFLELFFLLAFLFQFLLTLLVPEIGFCQVVFSLCERRWARPRRFQVRR